MKLKESWLRCPKGQYIVLNLQHPDQSCGLYSFLFDEYQDHSAGTKRPWFEYENSLAFNPKLRINGAIPSLTHIHSWHEK